LATTNSKFLVKNGLAVAGSTGAIDVINTSGQWIGATGTLSGATGVTGASGAAGATGVSGDRYLTTSTTSFTLADTGSQTVTVGTGLAYSANQTIILTYDASNHQHGRVTSYNSGTGSLTFDKYDYQGSGTYASWTVNLDGAVGAQGASGPTGATGAVQNWVVKTTTYTAVNKDSIVADTSGGAFTITLPSTPSTGWSVSFADPGGTWATNNLTVARNGSTIESSASDLILDVNNTKIDLVYDGSTWQSFANIGPAGNTGATGPAGPVGASGAGGGGGSISVTDDTSTNASYYVVVGDATSGTVSAVKVSSTKLYFNPSTGTLNATILNSLSDKNFKENINNIENPLDIVNGLNGVQFTWKDNGKKSAGLIAQEVEEFLPELIEYNSDEKPTMSLNYNGIIGVLVEAIKEQQRQIDELKDKIK